MWSYCMRTCELRTDSLTKSSGNIRRRADSRLHYLKRLRILWKKWLPLLHFNFNWIGYFSLSKSNSIIFCKSFLRITIPTFFVRLFKTKRVSNKSFYHHHLNSITNFSTKQRDFVTFSSFLCLSWILDFVNYFCWIFLILHTERKREFRSDRRPVTDVTGCHGRN